MFWAIMVLPRPLEPRRMKLRASGMKSRVRARSMVGRSIFLGQCQSKSAMGRKRPMRARRRRRSTERRERSRSSARAISSSISCGDQRDLVARARKSSKACAVAWRPSWPSCVGRSVAGFIIFFCIVGEFIVDIRVMRLNVQVGQIGAAFQVDRPQNAQLLATASLLEDVGDGRETGRGAIESQANGLA